jgi:hypothetical protein
MRTHRLQGLLVSLMVLAACATGSRSQHADFTYEEIAGIWIADDGSPVVRIEPNRLLIQDRQDDLRIVPIREWRANAWVFAEGADHQLRPVEVRGDALVFAAGDTEDSAERFQRAPRGTSPPSLPTVEFPAQRPLDAARVAEIQREIAARLKKDQEVLRGEDPERAAEPVIEDNLRYLRELTAEIGWIDRARFGAKTSYQAAILVEHAADLPFLLAALPLVEADFKGDHENPEAFAILSDSARLTLGLRQRYGSQFEFDLEGRPIVAPLEDVARVDEFRTMLGMPPLVQYLALASEVLFEGREVRVPAGD